MKKPQAAPYPNRLREFREKQEPKVTQVTLANALGVTQPTYFALESGYTYLSLDKAVTLAPLLRCQPWQLSSELEKLLKKQGLNEHPAALLPAMNQLNGLVFDVIWRDFFDKDEIDAAMAAEISALIVQQFLDDAVDGKLPTRKQVQAAAKALLQAHRRK